ncbi:MAG: DUF402 domain-containing protein [Chloroflexi bacterium]|nr:DUF402 domain-containing protein [Chloroflexota bacterium]
MTPTAPEVTIVKLDAHGTEVIRYPALLVQDGSDEMVFHARWTRPPRDLGYLLLQTGDRWTERFYRRRWYNIFEIRTSCGRLKGWYCNVCRPASLVDGELRCVDLELDLFVSPTRQTLRLDEDDFAALALDQTDPAAHQEALAALRELEAMARSGAPPLHES